MSEHPQSLVRQVRPSGARRWLPGVALARGYRRSWLARDLVAGLVLTTVLVPAGMGYAEASGLPAVLGLYATLAALLVYALLGPSRILVLGPDSALVAMIAAAALPLGGDPAEAPARAAALAIMAGLLCIAAGLARLGFLTDLLATPIRYGYLNGIALTVLVGQTPKLLGFSVEGRSLPEEVGGLLAGLGAGQASWATSAIGLGCLAIILGCKRWAPRLPGALIALALATLAAWLLGMAGQRVAVVGAVPPGMPSLALPAIGLDDLQELLPAAAAIALVSFADTSVLSRTFAGRGGYYVDSSQELIALGAANVASGLFQGISVSGSASRTPVAAAAGAQTQLTGVVGAGCIALLLVALPGVLASVPQAALGAVVIAACLALVELRGLARLYRMRRDEFALALACFLGVALLGVIPGIFSAVGVALLAFVWRAWRPYTAVLGRVDGLKGYHDIVRHPEARRIPGLVLFRWDAPLFFANAEIFREQIVQAASEAPTPTRRVVVTAEPITDIDTTAADMLADLDATLEAAGVELCFAELKGPVKDSLIRYGLFHRLGPESFFRTIGQAVDRYVEQEQVEWLDWEERQL